MIEARYTTGIYRFVFSSRVSFFVRADPARCAPAFACYVGSLERGLRIYRGRFSVVFRLEHDAFLPD